MLVEVDMLKEIFSKLLLGEDMSGGGKGVCTALAISNAITNLSGITFLTLFRNQKRIYVSLDTSFFTSSFP